MGVAMLSTTRQLIQLPDPTEAFAYIFSRFQNPRAFMEASNIPAVDKLRVLTEVTTFLLRIDSLGRGGDVSAIFRRFRGLNQLSINANGLTFAYLDTKTAKAENPR